MLVVSANKQIFQVQLVTSNRHNIGGHCPVAYFFAACKHLWQLPLITSSGSLL